MPKAKYNTALQAKRAQISQNNKYHQRAMTAFAIRFHNISDADVIAALKEQENKADYIRNLIRKDIQEKGK